MNGIESKCERLVIMENKNSPAQIYITDREKEVMQYLAKGYSAKMIANKLSISKCTIVTHREHLKNKLGAKNTPELISIALNWVCYKIILF